MSKKKTTEVSEQVVRVDGEIKSRKNVYYEKVSERYKIFAFLVVLSLAIFGGALMIIYGEYITYDNFVYLIRDLDSVKGSTDGFTETTYSSDSSSVFRPFRDGFAVVGKSNVTLFDKTGVVLCSEKENFSYPQGTSSNKYMLVYDIGGNGYSVYSSVTRVIKKTTEKPIISASVSNTGSYIVTTESGDAKYVTEVYNSDFKRTMSIYKDKYVLDSVIGKDGEAFAIISLGENGADFFGEVSFYKNGSDKPLKTYNYSMAMPITVSSYDDGGFSVLFDDCLRFFDGVGNVKAEHPISNEDVAFFDARSTGAVLVCKTDVIGSNNSFYCFSSDGKKLSSASIEGKVSGVYAPGDKSKYSGYILMTSGKVVSVGTDGKTKELTEDKNIKAIIGTEAGDVAMTASRAYLITNAKDVKD